MSTPNTQPLPPVPPLNPSGFMDPVWVRWLQLLRVRLISSLTAAQITASNGFSGVTTTSGTTTSIALSTSVSGLLAGAGGALVAADAAGIESALGTSDFTFPGNVSLGTVGDGLRVKEGANAKQGLVFLTSGAVVVANTSTTANSRIMLSNNGVLGTPGALYISARTPGVGFTISSTSVSDSSNVAYEIFEPA